VVELVKLGRVGQDRIDVSARRLPLEKFRLGLFDQRYVDVDAAAAVVGRAEFVEAGLDAQRASYTLLTNNDDILPLKAGLTVYVEGVDAAVLEQYAKVVLDPAAADVAVVRLKAPYEPRPGGFEAHFHAGSLEFPIEEVHRLQTLFSTVPTVVDLYLDRPAIVPEIAAGAAALLVSYGSSARAFVDVVFGLASPQGRLPFDLPSSTRSVEESRSDVPFDTVDPLFRFGDGTSSAASRIGPGSVRLQRLAHIAIGWGVMRSSSKRDTLMGLGAAPLPKPRTRWAAAILGDLTSTPPHSHVLSVNGEGPSSVLGQGSRADEDARHFVELGVGVLGVAT
jgi:hypothetical protein